MLQESILQNVRPSLVTICLYDLCFVFFLSGRLGQVLHAKFQTKEKTGQEKYKDYLQLSYPCYDEKTSTFAFLLSNLGIYIKLTVISWSQGAQWLSGRVLDSRPRGRGFEPHRRHCVVSLFNPGRPVPS